MTSCEWEQEDELIKKGLIKDGVIPDWAVTNLIGNCSTPKDVDPNNIPAESNPCGAAENRQTVTAATLLSRETDTGQDTPQTSVVKSQTSGVGWSDGEGGEAKVYAGVEGGEVQVYAGIEDGGMVTSQPSPTVEAVADKVADVRGDSDRMSLSPTVSGLEEWVNMTVIMAEEGAWTLVSPDGVFALQTLQSSPNQEMVQPHLSNKREQPKNKIASPEEILIISNQVSVITSRKSALAKAVERMEE